MRFLPFVLIFCAFFFSVPAVAVAACDGSPNCHACTNCKRCGHCKGGGSCGACKLSARSAPKGDAGDDNDDAPTTRPAPAKAKATPAAPELRDDAPEPVKAIWKD